MTFLKTLIYHEGKLQFEGHLYLSGSRIVDMFGGASSDVTVINTTEA